MEVLLKQNVAGLGRKGDVVTVKPGYFRFLQLKGLGEVATEGKKFEAEKKKKQQMVQKEHVLEKSHEIEKQLKGLKLTIKGKAGGDKLYGSITKKEILDALEAKISIRLGEENISLSDHIKVLGSYEIPVKLSEGIETKFMLEVKAEK